MKRNEFIKNIMTKNIVSVNLKDDLSIAQQKMESLGVHHIPVVEGKELKGIISRIDILKYSDGKAYNRSDESKAITFVDYGLIAEEVMTKKICVLSENNTVREASEILTTSGFNSLPIVNSEQELIGLLTTKDLLGYLLEQY